MTYNKDKESTELFVTKEENLVRWMNDKMYTIAHENPKIVERINDFNDVVEFDTKDGYRISVTIEAKQLTPEQKAVYE